MGRETRATWARRVRRWARSGLTAERFARQEGDVVPLQRPDRPERPGMARPPTRSEGPHGLRAPQQLLHRARQPLAAQLTWRPCQAGATGVTWDGTQRPPLRAASRSAP